uniref:NADAR domain-containing protein n=1 Tax=Romanomermis culicivorax TaxID=13658 RepID=A0A915JX55_ROMCU
YHGNQTSSFNQKIGRKVTLGQKNTLQWDGIKANLMLAIDKLKVSQNPNVYEYLMSTGNRPLIEAVNDKFWGQGNFDPLQSRRPAEKRKNIVTDSEKFRMFDLLGAEKAIFPQRSVPIQ